MQRFSEIIAGLRADFEEHCKTLKTNHDNNNERILQKYNEEIKKNNDEYVMMMDVYEYEFDLTIKRLNAMYDSLCVSASQNVLKLNSFPDITTLSFYRKYNRVVYNPDMFINIVRLYKSIEIESEYHIYLPLLEQETYYSLLDINTCYKLRGRDAYYELKYKKYKKYKTDIEFPGLMCIAPSLDVIVFKINDDIVFYRLSTGCKFYTDKFKIAKNNTAFECVHYNNSIAFFDYVGTRYTKSFYINITYYDITPDFKVTNKSIRTYKNTLKWVDLFNRILNYDDTEIEIRYSPTTPDIYFMRKMTLYIVRPNRNASESTFKQINLEPTNWSLNLDIYKEITKRMNGYYSINVIECDLNKSRIIFYIENFGHHDKADKIRIYEVIFDSFTLLEQI